MDHEEGAVQTPEEFRTQLQEITSRPCDTHEEIDDALRSFIDAVVSYHTEHDELDDQVDHSCHELLTSNLFIKHREYVRRQFIYSLLEGDEYPSLEMIMTFLLFDGQRDEDAFWMMQDEGLFPRIVELIRGGSHDGTRVHGLLLELLAEITRIKQLSREDLRTVTDAFITQLFQSVEQQSSDPADPYHYALVRVLLVLNEQYLCLNNVDDQQDDSTTTPARHVAQPSLPNRIVQVLSDEGPAYRTFGENLILLLNRESSLGPQLLILKMLYLLFTTPRTYEYFYTNDLYVLVDVILRNLLDLDPGIGADEQGVESMDLSSIGQRALRHTYLRVLFPLLRNTQLAREGTNYKRDELRRTLRLLASSSSQHFAPADGTVINLVSRCRQIGWIREAGDDGDGDTIVNISQPRGGSTHMHEDRSPAAMTDADVAKKLLGMNNVEAGLSRLSVLDVTAKVEKEEERLKRRSASDSSIGSDKDKGRARPEVPPPRRMVKRTAKLATSLSAVSPHADPRLHLGHIRQDTPYSPDASEESAADAVPAGSLPTEASLQAKVRARAKPPVLPKPRRTRSEQVG